MEKRKIGQNNSKSSANIESLKNKKQQKLMHFYLLKLQEHLFKMVHLQKTLY